MEEVKVLYIPNNEQLFECDVCSKWLDEEIWFVCKLDTESGKYFVSNILCTKHIKE